MNDMNLQTDLTLNFQNCLIAGGKILVVDELNAAGVKLGKEGTKFRNEAVADLAINAMPIVAVGIVNIVSWLLTPPPVVAIGPVTPVRNRVRFNRRQH